MKASDDWVGYNIKVPLGAAGVILCTMFPERSFAAALWRPLHDELLGSVFTDQRLVATDAGVMLDHPFLSLEIAGHVKEHGEQRVGTAKYLIVGFGDATLICVHPEVGYRDSFKRIVSGMTGTMRLATVLDKMPMTYHEIQVVKVQGKPFGFGDLRYLDGAHGERLAFKRTTIMIPRTASDWITEDGLRLDRSGADGLIIQASDERLEGGEKAHDLTLKRNASGYHIAGTIQGKPVAADLPKAVEVPDDLRVAHTLDAVQKSNGPWPARVIQWQPDLDPLKVTEVTIGCAARGGNGTGCDLSMGPAHTQFTLDTQGRPSELTIPGPGGLTISIQRVFTEGHL
jgi:hypothetical protein